MRLLPFFIIASFSVATFAQQTATVNDLPQLIKDFTSLDRPVCGAGEPDPAICNCVAKSPEEIKKLETNPDLYRKTILKFDNWSAMPLDMKLALNLTDRKDIPNDSPIYINILHQNDNWIGLHGMDSQGYTGALNIQISWIARIGDKSFVINGGLVSTLYSQRMLEVLHKSTGATDVREFNGDWKTFAKTLSKDEVVKKYTDNHQLEKNDEDTLMTIAIANMNPAQMFGWRVTTGVGVTDTNDGLVIHKAATLLHTSLPLVKYKTLKSEQDRLYSIFLQGEFLTHEKFFTEKLCSLKVDSAAGFSLDSSGKRNFLIANINTHLGFLPRGEEEDDRRLLGLHTAIKGQSGFKGSSSASASAGVVIDFNKVTLETGYETPLAGKYSPQYKTDFAVNAQNMGFIKVTYKIFEKKKKK